MSNEYPLYPELPAGGAEEAEKLVSQFKGQVKKAAEEAISNLYVDILPYIETDAWTNFRNVMMDGFRNYNNRNIQAPYDFKRIREEIYREFRDEIIIDLNQDLVEKVAELEKQIEEMRKWR